MTVRLPSHEHYASAVEKELAWLPIFKSLLTLPIPVPVAQGKPTDEYPPWSVNQWIEGDTVTHTNVVNLKRFAEDLTGFLKELEAIDASHGIPSGIQNFHRGGNLSV
jgi:aminoglycoside phosphotransferase (APT) family kinase protein